MIREVRDGQFGLKRPEEPGDLPRGQKEHYLAYTPIRFYTRAENPPVVYAGLAYVDVSRLTLLAGYKQVDIIFLITVSSAFLVALLIFVLGRTVTGPMLRLAQEVQSIQESGRMVPIAVPVRGLEVEALQSAINRMIGTLKAQMEEIRVKDRAIAHATMKEVAWEMDDGSAWAPGRPTIRWRIFSAAAPFSNGSSGKLSRPPKSRWTCWCSARPARARN